MSGMALDDFLSAPGRSNKRLAGAIGVPSALVSQWRTGARPVPIARCAPIERATNGQVRRWDLRPRDWHLIWPELIGHPDAPAIPAETKETA